MKVLKWWLTAIPSGCSLHVRPPGMAAIWAPTALIWAYALFSLWAANCGLCGHWKQIMTILRKNPHSLSFSINQSKVSLPQSIHTFLLLLTSTFLGNFFCIVHAWKLPLARRSCSSGRWNVKRLLYMCFILVDYIHGWNTGFWNFFVDKAVKVNHFFVHNCLKAVLFWNLIFKTFCCHSLWTFVGVMPPDEYVINVNNSAFTNMVAIRSLESAASIALYLGLANHTIYSYYACHIYMPFDRKLRYHPEYDGYILGKFSVKII